MQLCDVRTLIDESVDWSYLKTGLLSWASPANLMRFPSERYLLRNGQNGRRALQAQDARAAHENRLLDVRDGASYHRVFAALNLTRRERRLAFAKRLYTGELPDAALHAFADWNMREMLDE